MPLKLTLNKYDLVTLKPGESRQFSTRPSLGPQRVRAFDLEGNLKFDHVYTWEDLKAASFRVVIE